MGAGPNSLRDMEDGCSNVRKGNISEIERLSIPFLRERKGLLAMFRRGRTDVPDDIDLLAASEALLTVGSYREAVTPLESLIEHSKGSYKIRDLALARAGQIAVSKELPMDLSPIVSELGLSKKDLGSALMWVRTARGRKDPLVEMEKVLFQSMLLWSRTDWIESERFASSQLRGALEGLKRAVELAEKIDEGHGTHHICRTRLELGRFFLSVGEFDQGMEQLERVLIDSRMIGSVLIQLESLLLKGIYEEDEGIALEDLKEAKELAMRFRNSMVLAEVGLATGNRLCAQGKKEGVDHILNSAGIIRETNSEMDAAKEVGEAALWEIRLGDPGRGISLAKESYKALRAIRDREAMTRILCILFFGYVEKDDRGKAKKLLLEIVSEYPVKQFPQTFAILKEAVRDGEWLRQDKDTSELFEEETIYTVSREAVDEIKIRAKEAYPNEFGAMLRGIEHITHLEPIMEGASNRSSFMFSMFSRFTQREVPGEGVVHSHPSGSARPSKADVSLFGRFPGINIIIAYPFEDDSMAAYDRMGNRVKLIIDK